MDTRDKLIEPLMKFRDGRETFYPGERRSVTAQQRDKFCARGWAKDVSGEVPTAEPAAGAVALDVKSGAHGVEEIG